MKIFGRPLESWARNLSRLPDWLAAFYRCFAELREPLSFLKHYFNYTSPGTPTVDFRNGLQIHITDDPEDITTVFVIFMRRDYGNIPKNSTIIDIGANIGVFALYALTHGASKVIACEPSAGSRELMRKNLEAGNVAESCEIVPQAVYKESGVKMQFSITPSVHNSIFGRGTQPQEAVEEITTISLKDLLADRNLATVDLIKVDCEGAEYPIFLESKDIDLRTVSALRMEYHRGQIAEMTDALQPHGLKVARHLVSSGEHGLIWYARHI